MYVVVIVTTEIYYIRGGSRLIGRGSQSVVVICRSTCEVGEGGNGTCSTIELHH